MSSINRSDGSGVPTGTVQKFFRNGDIDTGSTPEDIWDGGGVYGGFALTSAQPIELLSDNAADTAAGTGARSVRVFGLDDNLFPIQEDVIPNGVTPVALVNNNIRIFRAQVLTAGTNETNVGTITIRTTAGATPALQTMAQILPDNGQTLMGIFTTQSGVESFIARIQASMRQPTAGSTATGIIQTRLAGASPGAWATKHTFELQSDGSSNINAQFNTRISVPAESDIRVRATEVSTNNTIISGAFDLCLTSRSP